MKSELVGYEGCWEAANLHLHLAYFSLNVHIDTIACVKYTNLSNISSTSSLSEDSYKHRNLVHACHLLDISI